MQSQHVAEEFGTTLPISMEVRRWSDCIHMFKNGEVNGMIYGFGGGFRPGSPLEDPKYCRSLVKAELLSYARLFQSVRPSIPDLDILDALTQLHKARCRYKCPV